MSQPKEQPEPSMEEILSSIRRIIADEDTTDHEDAEPDAAEAPAEGAHASESETDDVLELTRVVHESGEVVDLNLAAAQRDGRDEPEAAERLDAADVAADSGSLAAHGDGPGEAILDPAEASDAAQAWDHPQQPSPSSMQDNGMEKHETAMQTNENGLDSLISDHAAGMATGAFAKLTKAVQRTPPEVAIAEESGRTVEQFVEDMIRPMLRDWLDQNMAPLVERIVQKEIQKIVRRAEID